VTDEWYIAMDKPVTNLKSKSQNSKLTEWGEEEEKEPEIPDTRTLRERMKNIAGKINWIPGFGKERELDWLNNMHDWLISKKNRYWGLALPIWECAECRNFEVIGSKEELEERSVSGWKEFKGKSPHKPQIDAVKIKCSKCGSVVKRIEPVGNPWLDAGIVSFSTISENNQACNFEVTKVKPLYLADKESWQNWFPADFVTESFPGQFKNWFYSLIAMSAVLEDVNPMKTVLGFGTLFGEDGRPMHKSWGNSIEFNEGADKIGVDVMRWMFARANPADNMLFGYKTSDEVRRRFHLKLWNVYNFFVTYANLDGWKPEDSGKRAVKSSNVLDKWILARLNQTITSSTESLEKFDAFAASLEIEKFVDDLSLWYVRRSRDRVGPAGESEKDKNAFYLTTHFTLVTLCKLLAPFTPFFAEEIYRNLTKEESVHLSNWPKAGKIAGESIISETEVARQVVEKAHSVRKEKVIPVRQPLSLLSISNFQFSKEISKLIADEVNVKKVISKAGKGEVSIKLDTKITKELKEEAAVRELVRKIQDERKNLGLSLTHKINVQVETLPADKKLLEWMMKKAQISGIKKGKFKVGKAS
jgi:isoleucyl-tRNA synthetase